MLLICEVLLPRQSPGTKFGCEAIKIGALCTVNYCVVASDNTVLGLTMEGD